MTNKGTVEVSIPMHAYCLDGNAQNVLAYLAGKVEEVPEEYRATARIDLSADQKHDRAYIRAYVTYRRPETAQERLTARAKEEQFKLRQIEHLKRNLFALGVKFE